MEYQLVKYLDVISNNSLNTESPDFSNLSEYACKLLYAF